MSADHAPRPHSAQPRPRPDASHHAPSTAGVRPARAEGRPDVGTLVYVDAGSLTLSAGEWVVFADEQGERVGRVVIAPQQVVESAVVGPLPPVLRRARPEERPATHAATAGSKLLRSLDLPAWAVESGGSPEGSDEPPEAAGSERRGLPHPG